MKVWGARIRESIFFFRFPVNLRVILLDFLFGEV